MTLNAVIALILRFFSPNSTDFQADYITVVEDGPIIFFIGCYSGIFTSCLYCVIAFRELSILCSIVFVSMLMSGLRLTDLNKETTYLLIYIL